MVEQASLAACMATAGLLLLLLLGTQILNWYWPVALFAASFALGVYRVRSRIPSPYRLAQRIDQRLGFHDALSTAYHFREFAPGSAAALHHGRAERIAASAVLQTAVPTPVPRSLYMLVGLFAMAATLFAMRYFVRHSLDLKAPIADIQFGSWDKPSEQRAEKRKSAIQEHFEEQLKQMGLSLDPVDDHPGQDLPPESPSAFTATPDGRAPVDTNEKGGPENGKPGDRNGSAPESTEKSDSAAASASDQKDAQPDSLPGLNVNGAKQQNQQNAQNNAPSRTGQNSSSMLDKMRDAMANLMAKLKMPSGSQQSESQQNQRNQDGTSPGQQQGQGQRQAGSQNKSDGQGKQNGQQPGESEDGEQTQMAGSGKSNDQSSSQPGGQDSKSGMGKQDGDKNIQTAEQLAAMGKISEIIGKRSAQIQGDMTVEVPSGKQQLRTAYSRRKAVHGDAGSELGREEIPLMLQPYIQKYFDEIRKTAPPRSEPKS